MTKSAIEKMVEWNKLERQKILNPGYLWGPARESDDARMGMIAAFCLMEKEARRLAAEEKSKPAPVEAKATAEGSLVDIVKDAVEEYHYRPWKESVPKGQDLVCLIVDRVLSRYRPASPAVEELVRELRALANCEPKCGCHDFWKLNIEAAIAKYDNAKGGK